MANPPKPTGDRMLELVSDLLGELNLANRELQKMKSVSVRTPIDYLQCGIAAMGHINHALYIGMNMQELILLHHRRRSPRETGELVR